MTWLFIYINQLTFLKVITWVYHAKLWESYCAWRLLWIVFLNVILGIYGVIRNFSADFQFKLVKVSMKVHSHIKTNFWQFIVSKLSIKATPSQSSPTPINLHRTAQPDRVK